MKELALESLGIDRLRSPNGALLRYEGRMVAMILFSGDRLTVSPPDGDDQVFDLDTEEQAALALLKELRDRVREVALA